MRLSRRLAAILAGLVLWVACAADTPAGVSESWVIASVFTDAFWVGDDASEYQFADIPAMAFAPNGHLIVLDGHDAIVLDSSGQTVATWGGQGEGPGEFLTTPSRMTISREATVAVESFRRVDVLTLEGELIGTHLLDSLNVSEVAFDDRGRVVARVIPGVIRGAGDDGTRREHVMRLTDREVLWSSPTLPPRADFSLWSPHVELAGLDRGRIAVGVSDRYDLAVLDAATGRQRGRITRDVPLRGPSEEFRERSRNEMLAMVRENDDPMIVTAIESIEYPERSPVITRVFTGPPDRAIWVRRGMGVADSLAPDELSESYRLYDLFDGDSSQYIGTVEIPEDLTLMAGDSDRVAGVHRDELGVPSVRVLSVEIVR